MEVPNTKLFLQDLQQNYPCLYPYPGRTPVLAPTFPVVSWGRKSHDSKSARLHSQAAIFEFGGGTCLFTSVFLGRISYTVAKKAQTSNICEHHVTNGSVTV